MSEFWWPDVPAHWMVAGLICSGVVLGFFLGFTAAHELMNKGK